MYTSSPSFSDYSFTLIRSGYYKAYYADTTTGTNNEDYDHLYLIGGSSDLVSLTCSNCQQLAFIRVSNAGSGAFVFIPRNCGSWSVHENAGSTTTASWAEYRIIPPAA